MAFEFVKHLFSKPSKLQQIEDEMIAHDFVEACFIAGNKLWPSVKNLLYDSMAYEVRSLNEDNFKYELGLWYIAQELQALKNLYSESIAQRLFDCVCYDLRLTDVKAYTVSILLKYSNAFQNDSQSAPDVHRVGSAYLTRLNEMSWKSDPTLKTDSYINNMMLSIALIHPLGLWKTAKDNYSIVITEEKHTTFLDFKSF